MIYRKVDKEDLPGIARLYKVCFNLEMKVERYDYWYSFEDCYSAVVAEEDGIIVGHNAFVINKYIIDDEPILIGLSAAGMVDAEKVKNPGTFLKLIEATRDCFNFIDIVVAFPNKKAEPFWTRVLKFKTISENYYYVTPDTLNIAANRKVEFYITRTKEFLINRTENHGRYSYQKHSIDDFEFIYKEYNGNIELVYISNISEKLVNAIEYLFGLGFKRVNIISIYSEFLIDYGFQKGTHNVFVYEWLNKKYNNRIFECQMIDSDVF
jgi:hypothetical protein